MNYTLEVSSGSADGPWSVMAAHTCDGDAERAPTHTCECNLQAAWRGGYDAARATPPKTVHHTCGQPEGVLATHARLRITFAGLGGFACGDLCLWSNPVFELRLWGTTQEEPPLLSASAVSSAALQLAATSLSAASLGAAACPSR
jgi:hypothetical protein